jgi:hypothetical protein
MLSNARHDDDRSPGARHDYRLFAERLSDFGGEAFAHARGELGKPVGESFLTDWRALEVTGAARVGRARPDDPGEIAAPVSARDGFGRAGRECDC